MIEAILQPWPWYISGPLIGLTVPALLLLAGKQFGVSSSLRHIGAACLPNSKLPYLHNHKWRDYTWNLMFVGGIAIGGFIANRYLSAEPVDLLPSSFESGFGLVRLAFGGLLVGFGTRYANGCTSGHTIMGVSLLNWPSMVASALFFVGGLITVYLLGFLF